METEGEPVSGWSPKRLVPRPSCCASPETLTEAHLFIQSTTLRACSKPFPTELLAFAGHGN